MTFSDLMEVELKQVQDAAKLAVTTTMQRLIRDDVQKLLNKVVEESISMVTKDLRFKLVPIDNACRD